MSQSTYPRAGQAGSVDPADRPEFRAARTRTQEEALAVFGATSRRTVTTLGRAPDVPQGVL